MSTGSNATTSGWTTVGPGVCNGETLVRRPFEGGYLVATIFHRKGYDAKGDVVDRGMETRAITFVPAAVPQTLEG